jgi:hypothetical protein
VGLERKRRRIGGSGREALGNRSSERERERVGEELRLVTV